MAAARQGIDSQSSSGHYWGVGLGYNNSAWRHLNDSSWGFAFRNSGGALDIYSANYWYIWKRFYKTTKYWRQFFKLPIDGNKVSGKGNDGKRFRVRR